jgi:hypothetical protein
MAVQYQSTYAFDANLQLDDGASAHVASSYGLVGGAVVTFDTGAAQVSGNIAARWPAMMVANITNLYTVGGTQTYQLIVEGSNDPTWATGVQQLGSLTVSATGQYNIPFINEQNGTIYEYLRLHLILGGTTPSITLNAFMVPIGDVI